MTAEVVFEPALQAEDGFRGGRLAGEGLVEQGGDLGTVRFGEGGEPFLPQGIALVAGEAVETLEVDDVGALAGGGQEPARLVGMVVVLPPGAAPLSMRAPRPTESVMVS